MKFFSREPLARRQARLYARRFECAFVVWRSSTTPRICYVLAVHASPDRLPAAGGPWERVYCAGPAGKLKRVALELGATAVLLWFLFWVWLS